MIEPDDVESGVARVATCLDVIAWIDEESGRILRQVARPNGSRHRAGRSDQDAAALGRRSLARVRDDGVADGAREHHAVSMTIAMPMPPPMHSAATPRRAFFARIA